MATHSLRAQIDELEYEMKQRRRVYPRLVDQGKLRSSEAEYHKAALQAAIDTLRWLSRNEVAVRAAIASGQPLSRPSADAEGHPLPQGERAEAHR